MRRNKNQRGRGGSRSGYRSGRGRSYKDGGRKKRGGRPMRGRPGGSTSSGNFRERIQLESGSLVLLDQFMLANPQFIEEIKKTVDDPPEAKDNIIKKFGGSVVNLSPATYRIARNPYKQFIVIYQDGEDKDYLENMIEGLESDQEALGFVLIDTRCLAMFDRELLYDIALIEKCNQLWFEGREKACRDLLRDNGGAVRYGFNKLGDELGVYMLEEQKAIALVPDVKESVNIEEDNKEEAGSELEDLGESEAGAEKASALAD